MKYYEEVHEYIGHLGLYQICLIYLAFIAGIYELEMITMVFVGATMPFFCTSSQLYNLSYAQQLTLVNPMKFIANDSSYIQKNYISIAHRPIDNSEFAILKQNDYFNKLMQERNLILRNNHTYTAVFGSYLNRELNKSFVINDEVVKIKSLIMKNNHIKNKSNDNFNFAPTISLNNKNNISKVSDVLKIYNSVYKKLENGKFVNDFSEYNNFLEDDLSRFDTCRRYNKSYDNMSTVMKYLEYSNSGNSSTVKCDQFVFVKNKYLSTIVSQFNLVCGYEWMVPLVSTLYMFGGLVGSVIAGIISDKYGRKNPAIGFLVLRIISVVIFIYASNYWTFLAGRCLLGFATNASRLSYYVLVLEIFGTKYGAYYNALIYMNIAVGGIVLSAISYFVRNHILYQIAAFFPITFILFYFIFVLTESPRWLLVKKRYKEVDTIWKYIADINKTTIPSHITSQSIENKQIVTEKNILDLFRCSELLKRTSILLLYIISTALAYFSMVFNIGDLEGDVYENTWISQAIDLPGIAISTCMLQSQLFGRNLTISMSSMLIGISQLVCVILTIMGLAKTVTIVLLVSRIAITSSVCLITIYSAELMPTQVRNTALGLFMASNRFGSMIAPFMGKTLTSIWKPLPFCIIGCMCAISGILCYLFLPETFGEPSCDTVDDMLARKNIDSKEKNPTFQQ